MRSCGFFLSICGLLLLVVVSVGATPEVGTAFSQFKTEFGRSYHDVSAEAKRLAVFDANYRMIAEVNSRNLSYTLGINQFADMTQQEFAARFSAGGLQYPSALQASESSTTDSRLLGEMSAVPAEVDWREKGAVNPIRNQFQCGACWAFSANAAAESAWALANGTLTHMSEQQLVDCSQAQGNTGCNGGSMDFAFQYMQSAGPSKLCDGRNYKYELSSCSSVSEAMVACVFVSNSAW
jgi:C1A family cysteine protease